MNERLTKQDYKFLEDYYKAQIRRQTELLETYEAALEDVERNIEELTQIEDEK
ncbi:hypothetical protein [Gracilimonas sp.]|uniref:hypothetical protein n=1 Tax=Gracilimonas sp. TaxID=1974203 RepID=UPI00287104EE|nr:hypothetical protein [Gracilimonas sp.]